MQDYLLEKLQEITYLEDFVHDPSEGYVAFKQIHRNRLLYLAAGNLFENKVSSMGCGITFLPLENYFLESSSGIKFSVLRGNHFFATGHKFGIGVEENFPLSFDSKKKIDTIVSLVEKFIIQDAQPFFDYWTDLRVFLPYLELKHDDFLTYKILTKWKFKKAIIWYLTSHPKYQEFVDFHLDAFDYMINEDDINT